MGLDPIARSRLFPSLPSDFPDLFAPDAPWDRAARMVRAFQIGPHYASVAPEEDLARVLAGLRQRGIALVVAGLMLSGDGTCGRGHEGYAAPRQMRFIAERIKRLGGEIRYLNMDEPVWFGHWQSRPIHGAPACRTPLPDLAQEVAAKVAQVRAVFPHAIIGQSEPVGVPDVPGWIETLKVWTRLYRQATGEDLGFFLADVTWRGAWTHDLRALAAFLRTAGIRYGVHYNGNGPDRSDAAWADRVEARYEEIESDPGLRPDFGVLGTWAFNPTRWLPETRPDTLTNLLLRHERASVRIAADRQRGRIVGRLLAQDGSPLPERSVRIMATDFGQTGIMSERSLVATVPAGAVRAKFRLRINTECNCSGDADITVGPMVYSDDMAGARIDRRLALPARRPTLPSAVSIAGDAITVKAAAGQPVLLDSADFAVVAGDFFTAHIGLRA
ncbi:MAG: hypothetical protein AB7O80_26570, partial [Acetobacteraceae bacterium]